jgi:hypothetical protein
MFASLVRLFRAMRDENVCSYGTNASARLFPFCNSSKGGNDGWHFVVADGRSPHRDYHSLSALLGVASARAPTHAPFAVAFPAAAFTPLIQISYPPFDAR